MNLVAKVRVVEITKIDDAYVVHLRWSQLCAEVMNEIRNTAKCQSPSAVMSIEVRHISGERQAMRTEQSLGYLYQFLIGHVHPAFCRRVGVGFGAQV